MTYLFEDAFVEELLELFVAVIDAELLEAIHLEILCKESNVFFNVSLRFL